jgi:hypothetical protein
MPSEIARRQVGLTAAVRDPRKESVFHYNNYRAIEIFHDDDTHRLSGMGGEDDQMELDEVDMQHLAATACPRLKSRTMHGDPALIGQEQYTRLLQEDVFLLTEFLASEARRSVVREFLVRHRQQVFRSHTLLIAVQDRYRITGVDIAALSKIVSSQESTTHVAGIRTDAAASKREKTDTANIVRGLLQTPDLLHKAAPASYHDRIKQIRAGGYQHSRADGGLQKVDPNLQAAQYSEGDIYNKAGAASTWDGTVYKQTLLASLRRKLGYKLYFDALHHHAISMRGARVTVLSIEARRLSKVYKLCFQSILAEALCARHTKSRAEMIARVFVQAKYMRPTIRCVQRWKETTIERTARWVQAHAVASGAQGALADLKGALHTAGRRHFACTCAEQCCEHAEAEDAVAAAHGAHGAYCTGAPGRVGGSGAAARAAHGMQGNSTSKAQCAPSNQAPAVTETSASKSGAAALRPETLAQVSCTCAGSIAG